MSGDEKEDAPASPMNVVVTPLGECLVAEVEPREHGYVLILYCVGEQPDPKAVNDFVGSHVGVVQPRDGSTMDS